MRHDFQPVGDVRTHGSPDRRVRELTSAIRLTDLSHVEKRQLVALPEQVANRPAQERRPPCAVVPLIDKGVGA